MPVETIEQLKERFAPGKRLTGQDFVALIDSMRNLGVKIPAIDINGLGEVFNSAYTGQATPATDPTGDQFQKWAVYTATTYPNFLDDNGAPLVVTSADLEAGLVDFVGENGVFEKKITTIPLSAYVKIVDFLLSKQITDMLPIVLGKNRMNKADILVGKAVNSADGSIVSGGGVATWAIFSPIAVAGSTQYTFSGGVPLADSRVRFEDINHNLISFLNAGAKPFTFTTPSNCAFVVMPAHVGNAATMDTAQLELGAVATTYAAYEPPKLSASNIKLVDYIKVVDADAKYIQADTVGKNKLNIADISDGLAIGNDGSIVSNAAYSVSGYIAVLPLTTYTYSGTLASSNFARGSFYNASKAFISVYVPSDAVMPKTFTTPANCYFLRINTRITGASTYGTLQIEQGSTATNYEAFRMIIDPAKVGLGDYMKTVTADGIYARKELLKTEYIDATSLNVGQATDPSGNLISNANWANFKPVSVLPNTPYTFNTAVIPVDVRIRYEDSAHNLISVVQASALPINFTTPANCAFVVVPAWNNNQTGNAATATLKPNNGTMFSRWAGTKWVFFGDSITFNNRYQKIIAARLGITYVNDAVAGSCVATGKEDVEPDMIHRPSLVTRADSIDLLTPTGGILIFAGTNDWYYSVPLGAITDTVDSTYYGAYKIMIQKLQAQNPAIRIAAINMLQRGNLRSNYATQKTYADATKEVCAMYGVPVYDAFARSGMTYENIGQYTTDNVHPKAPEGDKLIGEQFAAFMNAL